MKNKILIVDDEGDILDLLKYNLQKDGYAVVTAGNGLEALKQLHHNPDLIVLDVMMPELDGWEVCKRIKKDPQHFDLPIIFLTAKDSELDEVLGLELGADDYVTKPIKIRTLLARIKSVLRRKKAPIDVKSLDKLIIGDMEIHPNNYVVKIKTQEFSLPKKEFEVLLFLASHPDRVISREVLLNSIWGEDVFVVDRTIDVHIRKIREKIGPYAAHIETVKGVGYRFRQEG